MGEGSDIRLRFAFAALAIQTVFALLFGLTTEYEHDASGYGMASDNEGALIGQSWKIDHYYPMFQDVSNSPSRTSLCI